MQIRPIVKKYYSTDEVHTLATLVLSQVDAWKGSENLLNQLHKGIHEANIKLSKAMGNRLSNTQTWALAEADQQRDIAFKGFYKLIEISAMRQNKQIRIAADKVLSHLKKIDCQLDRLGYAKQSVELEVLFEEMDKVSNELSTIRGDIWLEELKKTEKVFLAKKKCELKEDLEKSSIISVTGARENTIALLCALVDTLNAMDMADVDAVIKLNSKVDKIIHDVEVTAKARLSRRNKEEDDLDLPTTVKDAVAIDLG